MTSSATRCAGSWSASAWTPRSWSSSSTTRCSSSTSASVTYATLNAPGMLHAHPPVQPGRRPDPVLHGPDRRPVQGAGRRPDRRSPRTSDGSIAPELNKYRAFVYPRTERWQEAASSPDGFTGLYTDQDDRVRRRRRLCQFGFGDRFIDCVVTDVGITEQLFTPDLAPLRAEVSITPGRAHPRTALPTRQPEVLPDARHPGLPLRQSCRSSRSPAPDGSRRQVLALRLTAAAQPAARVHRVTQGEALDLLARRLSATRSCGGGSWTPTRCVHPLDLAPGDLLDSPRQATATRASRARSF